jgi:hypothetical protein
MNKFDTIIDALELARNEIHDPTLWTDKVDEALAAARKLKALKPVGYMDSKGILFNETTHPQLNTPLYALDEVTK